MTRKNTNKVIYITLLFVQITLIAGASIIQYLSGKREDIMQYIYKYNFIFEKGIFNENNLNNLEMISVILGILFIAVFMFTLKYKMNLFIRIQSIVGASVCRIVMDVIGGNYFKDKLGYYYFIIAFIFVLVIQIVVVVGSMVIHKTKSEKIV